MRRRTPIDPADGTEEQLNRKGDWIAWTAVAITVWLVMSILVSLANPVVARSIWPALLPVFILAYGYLTVCYFVNRAKRWSEKYLDTLLGQQTHGKEEEAQKIQAMVEHVEEMEKKVNRIEAMLVTDGSGGSGIETPPASGRRVARLGTDR
ncbi:hypothetical protein R6Y95_04295 [Methanoculleus palmolei]|uniref:Uncharacterized protein n=1 Tax=Methanoculleus palmolei TaxID=72612 RepID=A0ABD8AAK5_9EURY|nr:hypothetical protein [Methanoculleus sp. UBA377]WOX56560.1 hypothetical protein R6Y95_04295 [Methanoculleus palmolei]